MKQSDKLLSDAGVRSRLICDCLQVCAGVLGWPLIVPVKCWYAAGAVQGM